MPETVHEHEHVVETEPILVRLAPTEPPEIRAAASLTSYRTIAVAAADTAPFQVLGLDKKRHKAQILVHNPVGAAVPAIPAFVFIGRQAQSAANGDARGAALVAGDNFPYESAAAMWLVPAGVACSISIIEERYL